MLLVVRALRRVLDSSPNMGRERQNPGNPGVEQSSS